MQNNQGAPCEDIALHFWVSALCFFFIALPIVISLPTITIVVALSGFRGESEEFLLSSLRERKSEKYCYCNKKRLRAIVKFEER